MIAPVAAELLERAGYAAAARMLRDWQPITHRPDERRNTLEGYLLWLEGARAAAEKHEAGSTEVELLEQAFDAVELELDQVDREARRAG